MTVLITGGAGFIAGHTVLAFVDRGEIPIVLDDLSTGNRTAVPSGVPFFAGDVGDTELVLRLVQNHRIDAILHFAAKIVVPESVTDPLNYYLNNTVKTHALLQAAVRANLKHFVFSSSAAVYGNPSFTPVSETANPAPLSPYGRSKLMSEYTRRTIGIKFLQKWNKGKLLNSCSPEQVFCFCPAIAPIVVEIFGEQVSLTHLSLDCPPDFSPEAISLCNRVKPFTMTTPERVSAVQESVRYSSAIASRAASSNVASGRAAASWLAPSRF
jgi:GDP-mannose 4,6 dehydratase